MSAIHLVKDYPAIAAIAKRIGYRKHKFIHVDTDRVTLSGTYWSDGSRDSYSVVHASGMIGSLGAPTAPPQFGGGDAPTVYIQSGELVIKTGVFCGKQATLTVYGRIS